MVTQAYRGWRLDLDGEPVRLRIAESVRGDGERRRVRQRESCFVARRPVGARGRPTNGHSGRGKPKSEQRLKLTYPASAVSIETSEASVRSKKTQSHSKSRSEIRLGSVGAMSGSYEALRKGYGASGHPCGAKRGQRYLASRMRSSLVRACV